MAVVADGEDSMPSGKIDEDVMAGAGARKWCFLSQLKSFFFIYLSLFLCAIG